MAEETKSANKQLDNHFKQNQDTLDIAVGYKVAEYKITKGSNHYQVTCNLPTYTASIALQPILGKYEVYHADQFLGTSDRFARFDFNTLQPRLLFDMQCAMDRLICADKFPVDWISEKELTIKFLNTKRLQKCVKSNSYTNVAIYHYTYIK